jgi:tripartite-type tricarboxylate transporter receptor subunit TctC
LIAEAFRVETGVSLLHVRAGRLKLLAIAGKSRLAEFPEVVTPADSGVGGLGSGTIFVMMAPAGTSRAIVDRVDAEVVALLRTDGFSVRLKTMNLGAVANTPAEARANLQADHRRPGKLLRKAGVKLD